MNGIDRKHILSGISPSFFRFDRREVDVSFELASSPLKPYEQITALEMVRSHMEEFYEMSGYGWDDEHKLKELRDPRSGFFLIHRTAAPNELVGIVHFRFESKGELVGRCGGETSLAVLDIHLEEGYRRRGIGRHALIILELIALLNGIGCLSLPVQLYDQQTAMFAQSRGFTVDNSLRQLGFNAKMEGFEVFSKPLRRLPAYAKSVDTCVTAIKWRDPDQKDETSVLKQLSCSIDSSCGEDGWVKI